MASPVLLEGEEDCLQTLVASDRLLELVLRHAVVQPSRSTTTAAGA
jgi:hypothetical protein